jgi:hypothetical protein
MTKRKVVTTSVEVFKVKGETMEIAFKNLNAEHGLENYYVEDTTIGLDKDGIHNGAILEHSKELYREYVNNTLSEHCIKGALYNHKPMIKDGSRIIKHNIVIRGTKKWITMNAFVTDANETLEEKECSKSEAITRAHELSLEYNKTVNVTVVKKLEGSNGIIYISEFLPTDFVDDSNTYVFWKYNVKIEEADEDEDIDENTTIDDVGQVSIKEDIFGYVGRNMIKA